MSDLASTIPAIDEFEAFEKMLTGLSPAGRIKKILERYPGAAISFSGAEDVVLIEMAKRSKLPFRVFTLDTGRLHPETYEFIETVRKHFDVPIEVQFPDQQAVQDLTGQKGLFSFYEEGHSECCGIRKVQPLKKYLQHVPAWITGQRKDQSPTRTNVPLAQDDASFAAPGQQLFKFNPLFDWSSAEVWSYIRLMEIPYNPLHLKGFVSIGCQPCTRPVLPNQHEREGRWWWEEETKKECGLHGGNLKGA